jgi:hypothetical protein
MSSYDRQGMWQRMSTHLQVERTAHERQDIWQEMCTNWTIAKIIYIAGAYHRTGERARMKAIGVEMEVNDYIEDMYQRIAAKRQAIEAARAASRCCFRHLRGTIETINHIVYLQENSRRLAECNERHYQATTNEPSGHHRTNCENKVVL